MDHGYDSQCCFRLVPLQICCKLVVIGDIFFHLFICGILIILATFEVIFIPFVIVQLMLAILSILFYIGIVKESDALMIPMIVVKIITMLIVGTAAILTWISFALSLFSLIYLESPIKNLSASTYLGLQSIAMTVCLTILMLEGTILHAGYKYFKRQVEQKNTDKKFISFVKSDNLTTKPTFV